MDRNKKKVLNYLGAFAFVAVLGGTYFNSANVRNSSDLLVQNVEALSDTEYIIETTWTCKGEKNLCVASCGNCRIRVQGYGTLEGEHKCIKISTPSNPVLPPPGNQNV